MKLIFNDFFEIQAKFNAFASIKGSNYTPLGWDNAESLILEGQSYEESLDLQAFGDTKAHLTQLARLVPISHFSVGV